MRHILSLILVPFSLLMARQVTAQGVVCDPTGQFVIFSNYDGGRLTINIDEDIPVLHIGVVSYDYARIVLTGPFVANVAAVAYVGYDGDNDHCSTGSPMTTTITGVPSSAASIVLYPPATLSDPNGYGSMICGYSCAVGVGQGGCNTAEQIAHYFQTLWGGTLRFHRTQYPCWTEEWAISEGGNCCAGELTTGVAEASSPARSFTVRSEGPIAHFTGSGAIDVFDPGGAWLRTLELVPGRTISVDRGAEAPGIRIARSREDGSVQRFLLVD